VASDGTGSTYVAGFTASIDFPTANPRQNNNAGSNDAFVAKFSPTGALVYATYLGGGLDDRANGLAVDATGQVCLTGVTSFPVVSALQTKLAGNRNAFVAKLNAAGNGLRFSTYLGGNGSDSGSGIALDGIGNVYVAGNTTSANFPAKGMQKVNGGGQDGFVAKLSADGSALVYGTYLGGSYDDAAAGVAVDGAGTASVTGLTYSPDFPVTSAFTEFTKWRRRRVRRQGSGG
jgi:hypothetical protein